MLKRLKDVLPTFGIVILGLIALLITGLFVFMLTKVIEAGTWECKKEVVNTVTFQTGNDITKSDYVTCIHYYRDK